MSIKNKSDELLKKIYGYLKDIDKLDSEEYDMFVYFQNLKNKNTDYDTLNHNIFTEFYKLISIPQFINVIDNYLDINKILDNTNPGKYSLAISNIQMIFKHILEKNNNILKKKDKIQVKEILDAFYYKYTQNPASIGDKEIMFLLYILYLDGCLYQYNNLHYLIELTYKSSFYKSETDVTMKLNGSIIEWLNNRNKLNNYMNNKTNSVNLYYISGGVYELNDELKNNTSYFIITDIYSKNDIQKILDLIDNTDLTESNIKLVKNLIKNNYIEVNFNESSKSSPLYYLYQILHTYDQIQYELVVCRIKQLINLKNQIYDQTKLVDSDEFLNSIKNMIYTLKQYFKYPLTFHIKITNKYSIFKMLSTDQNKVILEKYHKLKIVLEYLKNNKIDIKDKKKFNFEIKNLSMRTNKLSIDSLTNNHELLYDIFSLTEHIKNEINYFNSINDILTLSNTAKNILIQILSQCSKSPFDDNNSITNRYNVRDVMYNSYIYKIPDKLITFYDCCTGEFNKITSFEQEIFPVKTALSNYDILFPEIKIINDEIKRYNELIQFAVNKLNEMIRYANYIIIHTNNINTEISNFRSIIDLTNNLPYNYPNTYKNELIQDIHKSHDDNIDYDTLTIKNTKMNELFKINTSLGEILSEYNLYTALYADCFIRFKSYYDQIKTLNESIYKKKLDFDNKLNKPNGMKSKYTKQKLDTQTKIANIDVKMNDIDVKVGDLTNKNIQIDIKIGQLTAKSPRTPAENTELQKHKLNKQKNTDNINKIKADKVTLSNTKIDEQKKLLEFNLILDSINYINIKDYKTSGLHTKGHLDNEIKINIEGCLSNYDTYHMDELINSSVEYSFVSVLKNQTIVFNEIKRLIVAFNRKQNNNLPNNLLLHRTKKNMFEIINLSYQQHYKNQYHYEFNKMSSTFELITNEIFKDVLKREIYYDNINFIDDDVDTAQMLSEPDSLNAIGQHQKLNDYQTKYNSNLFKFWSDDRYTLFSELCYSELSNSETYSLFEIIDYLNNNFNLNMIEKIYAYLEIIGEVKPFNIDSYINMVSINSYINIVYDSNDDTYRVKYNSNSNPVPYNTNFLNNKSNGLKLFECNYHINDTIDDNCDILIDNNDMFNKIYVNYENLIKELNMIDTNLLIKELFKIRRNNNIKLMSDFHRFQSSKIEFNDNYVYNYCTIRRHERIKTSFFYPILNNSVNLQQFENSINKLAVLVIELINGV